MAKINIDKIDRKILQLLVGNARMPYLEIARECGISGAAIHQRVRKLDEQGVILGTHTVVDSKNLGYDVCAFVGLRMQDPSVGETTVTYLKNIPEIVECHYITGQYNLLIKMYCVDNDHLMHTMFDRVLRIPGVVATETFISLSEPFSRQIDVRHLSDDE